MATGNRNLQDIIPALFTGRQGQLMTPEEIARERQIAAALMQGSGKPITNWADGAAELVDAFNGARRDRAARDASAANGKKSNDLIASLLAGTTPAGGGAATSAGLDLSGGPAMTSAVPAVGSSSVTFKPAEREGYVMNYLLGKGLAPHQAAGFTGNLIQESSLNTGANNPGDGADGSDSIGVGQWNGDRARNLVAFAKGTGRGVGDLDAQLDFALHEMGLGNPEWRNLPGWGAEGSAGQALKNARDVQSAAAAGISYERPSGWNQANPMGGHGWDNRFGHAQRLAGMDFGQAPVAAPAQAGPVQVASLDPSAGMGAQPAPPAARTPDPVAAALVPSYQQQPYTAPPIRMAQAAPQAMNPAIIEAITSPYVDDRTREIGKLIMQRDLGAQQAASNRAFEIDKLREGRAYDAWLRGDQRAYDAFVRGDQRLYDDNVRQQGFARDDRIRGENNARTDERNAYLDARQGSRDARADFQADREFGRQVENDKKPPTSILEYEYAKQQGYAGTFAEWEAQNRKAAASNVNINNGEGDKFYENLDKKNAERFSLLSDGGQDARSRLGQLDQLGTLLKQSPSGFEARVKSFLGDYGINTDGVDSLQATTALIEKMVPAQREPGAGSLSDADIAGFRRSLPRVINQPGGNELILGTAKAIAQYDIKRGEIADMVADRAITPAEGRQRLRELENPLASYSKLIQDMGVSGDGPRVSGSTPRSKDGVPVGAAMTSQPPPQPASRAAYDALPSGATFMAPDGSIRKKP